MLHGKVWTKLSTLATLNRFHEQLQWTVKGESVTGYEITSKKNGKSIFQPTPGVYIGEELILPGKSGVYWSSKIHQDLGFAYNLNIGKYRYEWYWGIFERGFSVRPVQKNK